MEQSQSYKHESKHMRETSENHGEPLTSVVHKFVLLSLPRLSIPWVSGWLIAVFGGAIGALSCVVSIPIVQPLLMILSRGFENLSQKFQRAKPKEAEQKVAV